MGGQAPCALQVQLVIRLNIMLINIITTSSMTIIIGSKEGSRDHPLKKTSKKLTKEKAG